MKHVVEIIGGVIVVRATDGDSIMLESQQDAIELVRDINEATREMTNGLAKKP